MQKKKESRKYDVVLERHLFDIILKIFFELHFVSFISTTECAKCGWRYDLFELFSTEKDATCSFNCFLCGQIILPTVVAHKHRNGGTQVLSSDAFTMLSPEKIIELVAMIPTAVEASTPPPGIPQMVGVTLDVFYSAMLLFGSIEAVFRLLKIKDIQRLDKEVIHKDGLIVRYCGKLPNSVLAQCVGEAVSRVSYLRRRHGIPAFTAKGAKTILDKIEEEKRRKSFNS